MKQIGEPVVVIPKKNMLHVRNLETTIAKFQSQHWGHIALNRFLIESND